ncbi:SpoIIE family protein phosphatase [Zavarzinia sp. CC-PAN008]|uniref:SpoIIE family protein phosphatase n=1 Tax=Zavarzinia sp. CC-PAN008 TaxID=3243332 RepID=UPI003F7471E7
MLLRSRIALIVAIAFAVLTLGLAGAGVLRERVADARYAAALAQSQDALWRKILEVRLARMEASAQRLSLQPALQDALERADRPALDSLLEPELQKLQAEGVATTVEVLDIDGLLIYAAGGPRRDTSVLDAGTIAQTLRQAGAARVVQQDQNRRFEALVALSFGRPDRVGAIVLASPLQPALDELRATLDAAVFVVNRRGRLVQGSDTALWDALHPEPRVRAEPVSIETTGTRTYTIVTQPMTDLLGRAIAFLVTMKDTTVEASQRSAITHLALGGIALFLVVVLVGLQLYLANAFQPLEGALAVLRALSQGDTSVTLDDTGGGDEIGRMAQAVTALREDVIASQRAERQREKQRRRQSAYLALRQELDIAGRMQQSILPTRFPRGPEFRMHALMRPQRDIGGDFYDVLALKNGQLGLVVADVSGKGIPAALFMAISRTVLRATALSGLSPAETLATANDILSVDNPAEMFVTLFYAIYDPPTGRLLYCNGGHNPPLIRRADGRVDELRGAGGIALGMMDGLPYDEAENHLAPGDTLLIYSDGVTEALNPAQEEFEMARLSGHLGANPETDPEALVRAIVAEVDRFAAGAIQADDITVLALHALPDEVG